MARVEDLSKPDLFFRSMDVPIVNGYVPFYKTNFGVAFLDDSLNLLKEIPDNSINLIITSPPYALEFKKKYGNVDKADYTTWFLEFAKEFYRILTPDGSFVLNIAGSYNKGVPTKSLYHYQLLISLVEDIKFHLAQEFFWYNPAKMPVPAEWVTVRRIRVKDSVEQVWWLSKSPWPKANNRKVLKPYSKDMIRLNSRGVKKTVRPSGHNINNSFTNIESGGSIPPNVFEDEYPSGFLKFGNNAANDNYAMGCKANGLKMHPARYPDSLPEFFINLLTEKNDIILDPFAGSNTTGSIAEKMQRKWIAIDRVEEYLEGSKYRFK
ncbi:MAG: site-specific DNA-methyltransferase [Cyclobacteriaceae bacterium]